MTHTTDENPENWLHDYGDRLYRYALVRVRSEATAEDLRLQIESQDNIQRDMFK